MMQGMARITPAGAGKTSDKIQSTCAIWDHPRRCGENVTVYALLATGDGSPPQVRGKPRQRRDIFPRKRITPAGAGKTLPFLHFCIVKKDHPRRCGENCFLLFAIKTTEGSPPQVRGKPHFQLSLLPPLRITPAGAGKTKSAVKMLAALKDHPRRCGENTAGGIVLDETEGSPPQVRGKRFSAS